MYDKAITCSFTGHRPDKLPWRDNEADSRCIALKQRISDALDAAYQGGYRHFICGMAMGCDLYFCECVLALRAQHDDVTIEAAIPCPEQAHRWSHAYKARYQTLRSACDYETIVSAYYHPGCMQRRNRYMVDRASLLIAAFDGSSGGTQSTVLYAIRSRIDLVDLPIVIENA